MRKYLLLFAVIFLPWVCYGAGNEPVTPLPAQQPNASSYQQTRTFLRDELPAVQSRIFPGGQIVTAGGVHSTSVTMVSAAFSTEAYTTAGQRVTADSVAINYTSAGCAGTDVAWVIISGATENTLDNFERAGTSNYFVDCTSTLQPTLPAQSAWLMKVTITASALAAIEDIRSFSISINTYTFAMLPAPGHPGVLAYVRDAPGGLYIDTGTQWISLDGGEADVRRWGAVGDCVTDDTPAFLLALAASKRVVVPNPTVCYRITGLLTVPNNTWIVGAGKRSTRIQHAFNGDMIRLMDGSGLLNLYLDGNGDTYSGGAVVMLGGDGRQTVEQVTAINFQGPIFAFETLAGSQSSFHAVEMARWDITTHNSAGTGSELYAVVIDPTQNLDATPRKFSHIETNGAPGFDFGGANGVFVSNSFFGDLKYQTQTRGVHLANVRWANQITAHITGYNNTIVGSGISPELIIDSGSDDWAMKGNSYNRGVSDNSGNNRNNIELANRLFSAEAQWTAGCGTNPVLGNGDLRASYSQIGTRLHLDYELTIGTTSTTGDSCAFQFNTPFPYVGVVNSPQTIVGSGYAISHLNAIRLLSPVLIVGTNVITLHMDDGQVTFNYPWIWTAGDIIRFSIEYAR